MANKNEDLPDPTDPTTAINSLVSSIMLKSRSVTTSPRLVGCSNERWLEDTFLEELADDAYPWLEPTLDSAFFTCPLLFGEAFVYSPERGLRKGEPLPPLLVSLRSLIGDLPYKYDNHGSKSTRKILKT